MNGGDRGWARIRQGTAGAVLVVVLLVAPASAQSRVGGLDSAFGSGGRVETLRDVNKRGPVEVAIARDGSMVVAKERALARFLPNGRPDASFGQGGRLTLSEEIDGMRFSPRTMAIDSQGRLLVFGSVSDSAQTYDTQLMHAPPLPASLAVVLRLRANGELDPSFGEGSGFVRSDFGLRPGFPTDLPMVEAVGRVDSENRPVLIANAAGMDRPCAGHTTVGWFPRAVIRLTTTGGIDTTFGGGDGTSPIEGYPTSSAPTLALDSSDQPLAAVGSGSCPRSAMVIRLDANGSPLAGFGVNGARVYPKLGFSLLEPSGTMILRRGVRPTTHVIRVGVDGNRDKEFGNNGSAKVKMPTGAMRTLQPVAVDARGRILLAGSFVLPKPLGRIGNKGRQSRKRPPRSFFAVTRLLANGKLDLRFGKRGWIVTPFARPKEVVARQGTLVPQGRLVVAGSTTAPRQPRGGVALVRYLLGN